MSTPNLGLTEPTDHGSTDVWGALLNAALDLIDAHDHTTGKGVKVPSAGLKINADVAWAFGGSNYAITDLRALDLVPVAAASVSALADALFVSSADNELYWRNHSGTNVKITSGTTLNVSVVGGIGGDYASVGALLSFDDASDSYWLQQQGSPRPWARMRSGDVDIYETAASIVNRVRIQSPAALAASYAMTLPPALPATLGRVTMTAAGVLAIETSQIAEFSPGLIVPGGTATGGARLTFLTENTTVSVAPIQIPVGAKITAWKVWIQKVSATGTITAKLIRLSGLDASTTQVGSDQTNGANNPGFITLGQTALTEVVTSGLSYHLTLLGGGTTGDFAFGYEVTYQLSAT